MNFTVRRKRRGRNGAGPRKKKASAGGLDKIWLKSGTRWARAFSNAGLKLEAKIPGYLKAKIQQVSLPCI